MQHGKSKTKVYKSWLKIRERCRDGKSISYYNYGAKGIKISDSLHDDFMKFYNEVGDPPAISRNWSVDRIDNTLGYIEGNLKWSNRTEQARNKSKYVNNSSGVSGINFYHSGNPMHATYAVAQWKDITGKNLNKKFSVRVLGLMPAFKAACLHREKEISNLNLQGAGYSSTHGRTIKGGTHE